MGDSAYSFSLTTFSKTGKLLPIEYALNAVANGKSCLGICTSHGVVIASDKKLPTKLVDSKHVHKIEMITSTSGFCFAGLGPDYRVLVKRARKSAAAYLAEYGEEQPVNMLVKATAGVMQEYTQRGGVRPFGVSLLVAGCDADGVPALYQVDPSGAYIQWKATAIGKNHTNAKSFLEKRWNHEMELDDAVHTALLTLREGFEGEVTATNITVAVCRTNGKLEILTPNEIKDYLDEAN